MNLTDTYIVYGLGKSGLATAKAILNAGGTVYIGDDKPIDPTILPLAKRFQFDDQTLPTIKAVIVAPGIPYTHPTPHKIFTFAKEKKISAICDIEFFYRLYNHHPDCLFLAITGTNGKSTVTALTAHILKEAGYNAHAGGNIGYAIFDLPQPNKLKETDKPIIYVLEISSYQADLCYEFSPDGIAFLNLTPDHIDRHGSIKGYFEAKMRLFQGLMFKGKAVISNPNNNEWSQKAYDLAKNYNAIQTLKNDTITEIKKMVSNNNHLAGNHNLENAIAACGLAKTIGCNNYTGIKNYVGLSHRLEYVCDKNNIRFINDSKATNADATQPALLAFNNIFWLAGGVAKEEGIKPLLTDNILKNIKKAYFYGDAGKRFMGEVQNRPIAAILCKDMNEAINLAYHDAIHDESSQKTLLLSPACASFDAFKNFEHRGDIFKEIVLNLGV